MSDDLIARLRDKAMRNYPTACGVAMDEAADAIEELRAEVEQLKADIKATDDYLHAVIADGEQLYEACGGLSPEAVRFCIEFTRADHQCFMSSGNEFLQWDAKRCALYDACPPEVRRQILESGQ